MKTKITLVLMLIVLCIGMNRLVAQDLVPGINYSYNPPGSDGIITDIVVDVCNNEGTSASNFEIAIYLYDPATSDYWILDQQTVNSLSGNACRTSNPWNININNTPGIPAGSSYRIGLWVDSGEDITESDESNNAGLLQGDISYTPSATGIEDVPAFNASQLQNAPNPAEGSTTFMFVLADDSDVKLHIFNASGQVVAAPVDESLSAGSHAVAYDCSALAPGMYYYTLYTGSGSIMNKLIVVK